MHDAIFVGEGFDFCPLHRFSLQSRYFFHVTDRFYHPKLIYRYPRAKATTERWNSHVSGRRVLVAQRYSPQTTELRSNFDRKPTV